MSRSLRNMNLRSRIERLEREIQQGGDIEIVVHLPPEEFDGPSAGTIRYTVPCRADFRTGKFGEHARMVLSVKPPAGERHPTASAT